MELFFCIILALQNYTIFEISIIRTGRSDPIDLQNKADLIIFFWIYKFRLNKEYTQNVQLFT